MPDEKELTPQESVGVPATTVGAVKLGRGHEEDDDIGDMEMPRAKLIQFTSDEAQTSDLDKKRDPGVMINSLTGEILGEFFIPIFKFTNFQQWNPRKKDDPNFDIAFDPGALIFSTSDRRDPRVVHGINFGANGEVPRVTKNMNFFCYFTGQLYPVVLTFKKTSFSAGKKLNTLTKISGGDMFSAKYKLAVTTREGAAGKFFAMDVSPAGKSSEEEFVVAEKWFDSFSDKTLKVHDDEAPADKKGEEWPVD